MAPRKASAVPRLTPSLPEIYCAGSQPGAAAHSDHGRDVAHTLLLTAEGRSGGYAIKDEAKPEALSG